MIYDADMIRAAADRRRVLVTADDGTSAEGILIAWRPKTAKGTRTYRARVGFAAGLRTISLATNHVEILK